MPVNIEKILRDALTEAKGNEIHVRMEMPYDWGVTLSGEIDGKDISVPNEMDFAKYAAEFKAAHATEKFNIIDFRFSKTGKFSEKAVYDADFQKAQDAL